MDMRLQARRPRPGHRGEPEPLAQFDARSSRWRRASRAQPTRSWSKRSSSSPWRGRSLSGTSVHRSGVERPDATIALRASIFAIRRPQIQRPHRSGRVPEGIHDLRFPVAHGEVVRDDACAGAQLARQDRAQLHVRRGQQIEGHDRRVRDVDGHRVLQQERDAPLDAGGLGVGFAWFDQIGVDVDAHAPRAELLRRRDDDPAVAASEVVDDVARADLGQRQHALDDVGRSRDEWRKVSGLRVSGGVNEQRGRQRPARPYGTTSGEVRTSARIVLSGRHRRDRSWTACPSPEARMV